MKKVFAILLVLAVVVGFAFADVENHSLTIKSLVEGHLPIFQFAYSEATNDGAYVTGETALTNSEKDVVFDDMPSDTTHVATYNDADGDSDSATLRVKDISQSNVAVSFNMNLLNANERIQVKTYTIDFTVGAFAVYRSGVAGVHGADSVTFTTVSKDYYSWSTKSAVLDQTTEVNTLNATLSFLGTDNEATNSTLTIGTLAVNYPKDNTIDPNANTTDKQDGYVADITMKITAN